MTCRRLPSSLRQRGNLAAVEMLGGDEQLRLTNAHAGLDGLGPNAEKRGQKAAPAFRVPSAAI